jgi:hypothetical protein
VHVTPIKRLVWRVLQQQCTLKVPNLPNDDGKLRESKDRYVITSLISAKSISVVTMLNNRINSEKEQIFRYLYDYAC